MADDKEPHRTPVELVVKILTVHIVSTANYGYLCSLQHRSLKGRAGLARVLFFLFTPTLAYTELAANAVQSFINFIRDEAEDEITNFWFFLSAALGMHAYQKSDDGEAGGHKIKKLKLLQLSSAKCDRKQTSIDWAWGGKLCVCTFTLTQGLGTILVWIDRINRLDYTFGLDDRSGVMGYATAILSLQALAILLMRYKWVTNQPVAPQLASNERESLQTFTRLAVASLFLQDFTRVQRYRSRDGVTVGSIFDSLVSWDDWNITIWPFFVLAAFVIVLWKELVEKLRLGVIFKLHKKYLGARGTARLKALGHRCLMIAIALDVIRKIVNDIRDVVENRPGYGPDYYWRQGHLSEMIPVL